MILTLLGFGHRQPVWHVWREAVARTQIWGSKTQRGKGKTMINGSGSLMTLKSTNLTITITITQLDPEALDKNKKKRTLKLRKSQLIPLKFILLRHHLSHRRHRHLHHHLLLNQNVLAKLWVAERKPNKTTPSSKKWKRKRKRKTYFGLHHQRLHHRHLRGEFVRRSRGTWRVGVKRAMWRRK